MEQKETIQLSYKHHLLLHKLKAKYPRFTVQDIFTRFLSHLEDKKFQDQFFRGFEE